MEIIDNVLPINYLKDVQSGFNPDYFPWYFIEEITHASGSDVTPYKNSRTSTGFVHMILDNLGDNRSGYVNLFKPICYFIADKAGIEFTRIIRMRTAMLLPQRNYTKNNFNGAHIDHPDMSNFVNALFYVNDSDGDTFIFNESHNDGVPKKLTIKERVTPKENRVAIFDGWQYHASSSPIHSDKRIVINITLETRDQTWQ